MRYLFTVGGIIGLFGLFGLSITDAIAQNKNSWEVACTDPANPQTCRMTQVQYATKVVEGKTVPIGKILGLTVIYAVNAETKKRLPYISIQMPLGVDLRSGAVVRVDKNKEIKLPFLQCTKAGCDASLELNSKLLRSILAGIEIKVGFRAWGGQKTSLVKASLSGFTKSFRKLK